MRCCKEGSIACISGARFGEFVTYKRALDEQKKEVRELVMAGLVQIKEGKTKDFNAVCDRLEKYYR